MGRFLPKLAITTSIPLDHQHTVFEDVNKTLSWKSTSGCSGYQLNSTACNSTKLRGWDQYTIKGTSFAVSPMSQILEYFKLTAVDRNTGETCLKFIPEVVIQEKG